MWKLRKHCFIQVWGGQTHKIRGTYCQVLGKGIITPLECALIGAMTYHPHFQRA